MSVIDGNSNPYARISANRRSWGRQLKACERLLKKALQEPSTFKHFPHSSIMDNENIGH